MSCIASARNFDSPAARICAAPGQVILSAQPKRLLTDSNSRVRDWSRIARWAGVFPTFQKASTFVSLIAEFFRVKREGSNQATESASASEWIKLQEANIPNK
jgi:hypothetical protein